MMNVDDILQAVTADHPSATRAELWPRVLQALEALLLERDDELRLAVDCYERLFGLSVER